ncbi:hypothetical protein DMENIID0001_002850 [Sergentomyia squamirostris]
MVSYCLIVLFAIVQVTFSEKVKEIFVNFSTCNNDSVIQFDRGFTMHVDSEYRARIRGCLFADSFNEAEVLVKVKNYELAPWDVCNAPDKKGPQYELVKMLHDTLELNFECPFKQVRNCMNHVIDMRRYRRYLKLLPKFNHLLLNFHHENDKASCIEVRTSLKEEEEPQD